MVEPEKPLKRKDQIMIDEEVNKNLEAQMQAELEEKRLVRPKEKETNIALIESCDKTQAMMDANYELAARLQEEEAASNLEQEDGKRQRLEEENESVELKRCLEIILEDDDDVIIKAIPLSSKPPTIVDYKIYKERRNIKIIKADASLGLQPGEAFVLLRIHSTFHSRRISRRYDVQSTYYRGIATCTHRGYAEAIVVPPILAEQFKLKHSLINMMTSDQYKDLLHACLHYGFTKLHQLDTFYKALNPADQDSLNSDAGGNLLERRTQDVLTIIENKSKIAKLTHAVNQQTSDVTTAMTYILKQFQATPPPASVKAVEKICVTCGGAHLYYQCLAAGGTTFPELRDNIQGYIAAAAFNYNQGNCIYRPPGMANQIRPPGFAQPNVQNNQNRSGSLPRNTVANPKGELKAITTRSGIVLDGPFVPIPPPFINQEEDECVEETLTDQDLTEYTIKVPPPLVQKYKPPSQRNFILHQRDPLHLNIPYPSRMLKQKQQEKDEKMLKGLLSNKEKLQELANTPLNENYSTCKALADLGASINLMPLSVWKKLESPAFLRTVHALIDVYGEEMILCDSDERLNLNMRHDTSIYSNQPQKESINLINVFNDSNEDFLEDLFSTNQPSGNPTFSSHPEITSPKVKEDIFDPEGGNILPEKLLDLDSTKDLHPPLHSDTENVYDNPFDSKREKIKESKLLIDELDLPCDFLLPFEYDSFPSEDFSKVDALPSTNNEDKKDKKLAISHAFLMIEDFDPPFYELPFFKEVPRPKILLLFSSENEKKVFKPGILTSEKVHSSLIT
nr:hypothetical protein [Tanacetum cinerariifolium]